MTFNRLPENERHYCNQCGRKRLVKFMEPYGRAAYGKRSWICKRHLNREEPPDERRAHNRPLVNTWSNPIR